MAKSFIIGETGRVESRSVGGPLHVHRHQVIVGVRPDVGDAVTELDGLLRRCRPCAEQLLAAVATQIGGQHADAADHGRRHRVVGVLLEGRRRVQWGSDDGDRRPDPVGSGDAGADVTVARRRRPACGQSDSDLGCRRVRHRRHHTDGRWRVDRAGGGARRYRCALGRQDARFGQVGFRSGDGSGRRCRGFGRHPVGGDGNAFTGPRTRRSRHDSANTAHATRFISPSPVPLAFSPSPVPIASVLRESAGEFTFHIRVRLARDVDVHLGDGATLERERGLVCP